MNRVPLDREALIAEALRRIRGRRDIEQAFDRLGPARAELADCLQAASDCVRQMARPAAAVIGAQPAELGLVQDNDACAGNAKTEALGFAYLLTCGYDSREALAWLDGDYTSYHLQDAIARELVFALGREVSQWLRSQRPGWRFARQALRDGAVPAAVGAPPWDPRRVTPLLSRFDGCAMGVGATSAGELVPLHSLLGVMLGVPGDDLELGTRRTASETATRLRSPNPSLHAN